MDPLAVLNHLFNFVAPALWLALLLPILARLFMRKRPLSLSLYAQAAINFFACAGVLVVGLWVFGDDGKMLTYLAMALVGASSQWLMRRAWRH